MTNPVMIVELQFLDRQGINTFVWAVYFQERLYSVEYTFGYSLLTNRQDFDTVFQAVA